MKKFPIVLDLETKHSFRDFTDPKKLGISVVAIYDYKSQESLVFEEKEINRLYPIIEAASYTIGYNIRSFDMEVLQGYYPGKTSSFAVFDILDDLRGKIGRRLALNEFVFATLGKKKSGHGLQAIDFYKEGKIDELKKYCLDDVLLTKELFEYGVKNSKVYFLNERGKIEVAVSWKKYLEEGKTRNIPLTLPF
jgi:DEAD/DEAH box helicase domain-containing protein